MDLSDDEDAPDFWIDINGYGGVNDYFADVDVDVHVDDVDMYMMMMFGDYGYDFTDDDSDYSDKEDHNKIFISLQDSHVLKKLNFHRAVDDAKMRLPRTRKDKKETYESLYKVLDELETLLKVRLAN